MPPIQSRKRNTAIAARNRMAKRAKRQRFFKENKQRIMYAVIFLVLFLIFAFMTPYGPEYYKSKIDETKMTSKSYVREGYVKQLYNLGMFYNYTFRETEALNCFNEIYRLYAGYSLLDYVANPEESFEKQRQTLLSIERDGFAGPPFKISDSDLPYVGYAIYHAGESMVKTMSRLLVNKAYADLYIGEFYEKHPDKCDPEVTDLIRSYIRK